MRQSCLVIVELAQVALELSDARLDLPEGDTEPLVLSLRGASQRKRKVEVGYRHAAEPTGVGG